MLPNMCATVQLLKREQNQNVLVVQDISDDSDLHLNKFWWFLVLKFDTPVSVAVRWRQCDQIWRFIGLRATF